MKKIIVLLFTLIGITSCYSNKHTVSNDKRIKEKVDTVTVNKDTLILKSSTQQPIIHWGHAAHASHISHISHYSSTL